MPPNLPRRSTLILVALLLLPACGSNQSEAKDASGAIGRVPEVNETVAQFKAKDPDLEPFFTQSAGYVVFPTIGEGAYIVGGGYGTGEAFQGGGYVGRVTLTELSVGAQIGGQSYSQLIFFEKASDFEELKSGAFEFGAEVTAIAANKGVAKNATFMEGVAAFIIPKQGLMASASVGGQRLSFDGGN